MPPLHIKTLMCCLFICILSMVCMYGITTRKEKRIAVIDIVKLFNKYDMKKELETMSEKQLKQLGQSLDSTSNQLQAARVVNDSLSARRLYGNYVTAKNKLDAYYKQSNSDIDEQVWKRLNPLLNDFGKQKGVHLIIGANGMGTVLYNDDYYDLTTEAITFINKKYADGN